jgi:gamma-glutamylputrescine oxidase
MTLSLWLDKRSQGSPADSRILEADLAIVGGGVMGAACAYFAACKSKGQTKKVVLLDAAQLIHGASGRNAGFVLRGIHTYYDGCVQQYGRELARHIFSLGEENQALLLDFMKSSGGAPAAAFEHDPSGSYLLASSLDELEALSRSAQMMKEDGFQQVLLKEDPLDRGFYGALYNPSDFGVNPVKLVQALLAAAEPQVLAEEAVRRLDCASGRSGGKISLSTTHRTVVCERVILATNAYSALLNDYFLDLVSPVRGQMLATAPLKKRLLDKLCYANFGWEYFRQLPDRSFVEAEQGYSDLITRPVQQALEHYLRDHFPELAGAPIDYRWSGVMAFTPDGLPLLGELPEHPGVFFVVGCNGHGLGYSMVLARAAVLLASGQPASQASSGHFSPSRASLKVAFKDDARLPGNSRSKALSGDNDIKMNIGP